MIRKLNRGLGISADVLIREACQQEVISKDIDWNAFPLAEMRLRGYFEGFNGTLRELKEYSAETVSSFLSSISDGFNLKPAMLRTSAHLRSNDKETDSYALWAWQVRVLQKAKEEQLKTNYVKGTVDSKWMRKLAELSWSNQGPNLAKEYLNSHGIHLIIEPHLPKTYLDGAVCISAKGNPVVALTIRHNKLDNFWFSLMHELAHIALHVDETETWFLDDLDVKGGDKIEQEADALAQNALIPPSGWQANKVIDATSVRELANKLSVAPSIIAGRVRYDLEEHTLFGKLFREKVKHYFIQ